MNNRNNRPIDPEALERFHDGELPESERLALEESLKADASAQADLASLKKLGAAIKSSYTPDAIPSLAGFENRIAARIKEGAGADSAKAGFWSRWTTGWKWGFGGAGVALAAALCFVLVWLPGNHPATTPGKQVARPTVTANGAGAQANGAPFKETIESDGTIYITQLPDSDIEIVYIFDVES